MARKTKLKRVECPVCFCPMVPSHERDVYACMGCYKAGMDRWHFRKQGRLVVRAEPPALHPNSRHLAGLVNEPGAAASSLDRMTRDEALAARAKGG